MTNQPTSNPLKPIPGGNGSKPAELNQNAGSRTNPMRQSISPGAMMGHRGGPTAMIKGENAKDFKGTMRKLIQYLGPYKIVTSFAILLAIASTSFSILGPKILGQATTTLFEGVIGQISGSGKGIDFNAIGRILLTALGLYILSALLAFIQGWIMTGVAVNITYRFRRNIAEKINQMPLKYFDGTNHGEIIARITNDVDTVNQTLSQSLSQIITSVVTVVGVLIMMLTISWQMTLVALLVLPLSLFVVRFIVNRSPDLFQRTTKLSRACERPYRGNVWRPYRCKSF